MATGWTAGASTPNAFITFLRPRPSRFTHGQFQSRRRVGFSASFTEDTNIMRSRFSSINLFLALPTFRPWPCPPRPDRRSGDPPSARPGEKHRSRGGKVTSLLHRVAVAIVTLEWSLLSSLTTTRSASSLIVSDAFLKESLNYIAVHYSRCTGQPDRTSHRKQNSSLCKLGSSRPVATQRRQCTIGNRGTIINSPSALLKIKWGLTWLVILGA